MQVERGEWSLLYEPSGKRVSNAWATCPWEGDNAAKAALIPRGDRGAHAPRLKGGAIRRPWMGPRPIS